jgi:hypothetical protein
MENGGRLRATNTSRVKGRNDGLKLGIYVFCQRRLASNTDVPAEGLLRRHLSWRAGFPRTPAVSLGAVGGIVAELRQ